jgi:hypothetical protein
VQAAEEGVVVGKGESEGKNNIIVIKASQLLLCSMVLC